MGAEALVEDEEVMDRGESTALGALDITSTEVSLKGNATVLLPGRR
jgi:hypothetical protein